MDTKNIKALESEIIESQKLLNSLELKKKEIVSCQKKIKNIEKSIAHEKDLRKLPCQAIGSLVLYNTLNENYDYFEKSQFNKVTRFVDHIEEKEKRYRKLYLNCTEHYIKDPFNIPINDLQKEQTELIMSYKLLSILANEIKGDVVSFNKVYNKLEDTGMFMTIPERQNQEYLSQISTKLSNVMNGLEAVFVTLQKQNEYLSQIEFNTMEISSSLWDISWEVSNLK